MGGCAADQAPAVQWTGSDVYDYDLYLANLTRFSADDRQKAKALTDEAAALSQKDPQKALALAKQSLAISPSQSGYFLTGWLTPLDQPVEKMKALRMAQQFGCHGDMLYLEALQVLADWEAKRQSLSYDEANAQDSQYRLKHYTASFDLIKALKRTGFKDAKLFYERFIQNGAWKQMPDLANFYIELTGEQTRKQLLYAYFQNAQPTLTVDLAYYQAQAAKARQNSFYDVSAYVGWPFHQLLHENNMLEGGSQILPVGSVPLSKGKLLVYVLNDDQCYVAGYDQSDKLQGIWQLGGKLSYEDKSFGNVTVTAEQVTITVFDLVWDGESPWLETAKKGAEKSIIGWKVSPEGLLSKAE